MNNPVSILEIAQAAGVSAATVSRVFNQPEKVRLGTREMVLAIATRHGYQPNSAASALRTQRSKILGVMLPTFGNPGFGVMPEFAKWVWATAGENVKPVFAAWPVGFDFTYVYWYLMRFHGQSPFSHHALDIRSFAMAYMNLTYRSCHKSKLQKRLKDRLNPTHRHDHIAVRDAIEQGELLVALLEANRDLHKQRPLG